MTHLLPTLPGAVTFALMLRLATQHPDWPQRLVLAVAVKQLRSR